VKIINWLLIFLPIAVLAELFHWGDLVVFVTSALAIVPLAGQLGVATEALADKTGPRLGGLLNASLGNAAELIIAIIAIRAGRLELVKASIVGSILGNILLVMGASILVGGLKNGVQKFNRSVAGQDATLMILAVIALSVPSFFNAAIEPDKTRVEEFSLATSVAILLIYVLSVIYSLRNHGGHERLATDVEPTHRGPHWSVRQAVLVLALAVAGIAVMSEFLVGSVESVTATLGFSEFFVGIIIVPIIGNIAEHLVAVQVAIKDQMDLSLAIAVGSSLQIALFVAPVLVFISLVLGNPLTLEFNGFEIVATIAASMIAAFISLDGESNWLEGAMLLVVYTILALAFFFLPAAA
jgi:Ca2+:H+ antiporter